MVRRREPGPAGLSDWSDVKARHVQEWTVFLLGRYSDCYASNQFCALQQFFKWHATEEPDERGPNPVANLKPPKIGDKLALVFTEDELAALLAICKGGARTGSVGSASSSSSIRSRPIWWYSTPSSDDDSVPPRLGRR